MRLLLISTFLTAGLIVFGGLSSSANETTNGSTNKGQTEEMKVGSNYGTSGEMTRGTSVINGEVTDIQGDTLMIQDEMGNFHSVKFSGTEKMNTLGTKDLRVGDKVHVEMKDGQLISFYKEGVGPGSSKMKEEGTSGTMEEGTKGNTETTP
jgi:hypothetical protein